MEARDVAFLPDLWVSSWREAMPEIDFDSRRDWLVGFLRRPMHHTLVAEGANGLLGFVTTEANYLHQLVAAIAAKGTGVAVRLLEAAKTGSSGDLVLDVNKANARAIRFYIREGFTIEAEGLNASSGLPTWRMVWRRG